MNSGSSGASPVMEARWWSAGAGLALLLCGALAAGCSKSEGAGSGSPQAAPQGVYVQVKGKTANIQGTGCLFWLNRAWSVQIFDKSDCTGEEKGDENALSFFLDKAVFPPDEKGLPREMPKVGAEYTTGEWIFDSQSLPDGPVSTTVKVRVLKIEKPYIEFEVVGFTPSAEDKEKGVEKIGGRVRARGEAGALDTNLWP